MKKSITCICVGIFSPLFCIVTIHLVNTTYAWSLRSKLVGVTHPSRSQLVVTDFAVANCGGASNQCCFTYTEFRTTPDAAELATAYAALDTKSSIFETAQYAIVTKGSEESGGTLRSFFGDEYDVFLQPKDRILPYAVMYIEEGYPAGFDYRCH